MSRVDLEAERARIDHQMHLIILDVLEPVPRLIRGRAQVLTKRQLAGKFAEI